MMLRRAAPLFLLLLVADTAAASTFSRTDDTRPRAPEEWTRRDLYGIDVGLGGGWMSGNVQHMAINASLDLMLRPHPRHEIFLDGRAAHSAFGGNAVIDKDRASFLYAYAFYDHLNVYLYSTHSRNRFLTLRYRTTASVGLCVHGLAPKVLQPFLISFGVTPEFEWWEPLEGDQSDREDGVRGTLRWVLVWPATGFLKLGVDVTYAPKFIELADFRLTAEAFFELKVTADLLSFRVTLTDEYDARPRPGVVPNDVTVIPSLELHLGR
jgi:hypothetical protein